MGMPFVVFLPGMLFKKVIEIWYKEMLAYFHSEVKKNLVAESLPYWGGGGNEFVKESLTS